MEAHAATRGTGLSHAMRATAVDATADVPRRARASGTSWRRLVGAVGRVLIAAGILVLLFVAHQLWGTGLLEARSQQALERRFTETRARVQEGAPPVPVPEGDAVAIITIPTLGLEKAVVEGVGVPDLKKGPGHYPDTPLPGQAGNAAIAGHRTTYGAPFYRLDELEPGDRIFTTTLQGRFEYRVTETKVVSPSAIEVLDASADDRLTLTTCNPRFSAAQRLIVVASLVGRAAPALAARPGPPTPDPVTDGLSGDRPSVTPAAAWGVAAAVIASLAWFAGRRWHRLAAYLVAAPVLAVVLFVFFENVARFLPANY